MKWQRETNCQRKQRLSEWHRHYCLLPTQARNGEWVWLDYIWRRLVLNTPFPFFEYFEGAEPPAKPHPFDIRPPPPKPRR